MDSNRVLIPPPVLAAAAVILQRLVPAARRARGIRRVAAMILAGGSAGLALSAADNFRRQHTTVEPTEPSRASTLVTTGPNEITRNPMYLGLVGLLSAHAVTRGSALAWIPVGAFAALLDRVQIPAEEEALREKFGEAYVAYCERVPRWAGRSGRLASTRCARPGHRPHARFTV